MSEAVIAAICLLETRSVDEIVGRLTTVELEQVIKIVGRCPRCYPPGAYDALKGHRRTPSSKPQPGINPGPERSHRSAEQTKPATQQRWIPPRRFAGFGAKAAQSTPKRATANPYGISLDRAWTEWAAKHGLSETIAAALYLISENRKTDETVIKLTPADVARVIDIVQCWPCVDTSRGIDVSSLHALLGVTRELLLATIAELRHILVDRARARS